MGQTRQTNVAGAGARRCTMLSHSVSTARAFGVKDVEDNDELAFTAVELPNPNPAGTDYGPQKRNYIQIAWRSVQDAVKNMEGFIDDGSPTGVAKRLSSFKIDIRVEYVVLMKDPLPRANIPRPLFIGRSPWSKRTGKRNPMSKYYSHFGYGAGASGLRNAWKIFNMGMPYYRSLY